MRAQIALTLLPIAVLFAMAGDAVLKDTGAVVLPEPPAVSEPSLHGLVIAYMAVYFAYSGWINVIYIAGEVRDPGRNIPRSLIGGTLAVIALYIVLCLGFLRVLGLDGIHAAGEVGSVVAAQLGGDYGRCTITFLIGTALLASINATVLGGARVAYAMALGGAIWPILGVLSESRHVPHRALILQALIAIVLIITGKFDQLLAMVSLAMVLTGTLTVSTVFVLRYRRPDLRRPYYATGYPALPAIYVLSSLLVLTVMARGAVSREPGAWYPLLGLGVFVVAVAAHRRLRSSGRRAAGTAE